MELFFVDFSPSSVRRVYQGESKLLIAETLGETTGLECRLPHSSGESCLPLPGVCGLLFPSVTSTWNCPWDQLHPG